MSEHPKPVVLAEEVEYQAGAIVSKVLVKAPSGTVTLFAFGAGEGLSEHTAPFDALVVGVEGDAEIGVGDDTHRLTAGQRILLPANVPHSVRALAPFKMLLVMIRERAE